MKSQFHERPQSKKLRIESATHNKRLNKQKAEEYFKKGKAEQLNKAYDKAVDLYMKATLFDPNYYQAYCNLGSCYRILGKYYDAKNNYLKAVHLNKEDAITHYNLANLYRVIGNYEEAINHYEFVIRLKEEKKVASGTLHVDSLVNIGICYKNLGCYQDAIRVYQQVNELSPNDEGGIFNHAMCLLCTIQSKSSNNFHELLKERAEQAKHLFNKALEINSMNQMAKLALIKLTYLADRKEEVLKNSIQEMKKLLTVQNCTIEDEINESIGYCLHHLKKFKESAKFYENSVNNLAKRSSKANSTNLYDNDKADLFSSFELKKSDPENNKHISLREGIELINKEQYKLVQDNIEKMNESNLTKHTLRLILYVKLAEDSENYKSKAFDVYKKYFVNEEVEIPYEMISIQCHKAIAKLLTLHNMCENAIKHYEFIADSLKDTHTLASARLHSSLGEGFEEVGQMSKALQEYQRAYQLEPDNFSLSYNIGCCLFESGNYDEAKQYFMKFKSAVEKDPFTDQDHKKLYITDCMITLALCSEGQPDELARYQEALSILAQLRKQNEQLQLDESNVLIFYVKMADLLQIKMKKSVKYSQQYEITKEKLLKVFEQMLDLNDCPDRNAIFNNCGNIYYEEELYLSAISVYQQITDPSQTPNGNIALAYLHLMQELMAVKFIQLAYQKHQDDLVTEFNRDIVSWIYCNDRDGRWNSKLPAVKKDLFYERNEYGIALIDKLTYGLNTSGQLNEEKVKLLLQKLFENDMSIKLQTDRQNKKFQQVKRMLFSNLVTPDMPTKNLLSPNILKACFSKSENIKQDFQKLTELLLQLPRSGNEYQLIEVVIYIFIYYNQYDSFKVQDFMTEYVKYEKNGFSLDLDKLIENNEDVDSIEPSYDSVKKLTILLKEWQSILQKDTVKIIRTLEEVYYSCKILKPFQTQYHFPRHAHLRQCDETFTKTIYFVLKVIEYKKKITCKGSTIVQMKDDLIKQFQIRFNSEIKFETLKPITLSENFLPVTLFGYFQSRKECQKFVNTVCKHNTQWVNIQVPECKQYTLVFNNLVEVKCHWFNPFDLKNILNEVMENILNDPLYIVNQAIVALETLREVVKADSLQGAKMINQDSSLR